MLTCREMQALEERAFEEGATPEDLMEKVGLRMAKVLLEEFPRAGTVVAYLGKGHNAGDALVTARHLRTQGWKVKIRCPFRKEEVAELTRKKWRELGEPDEGEALDRGPVLLLDGLVGIGAKGGLRTPLDELAWEMNELRRKRCGVTIAMDIPSGLNGENGEGGAVVADWTFTVGVPKKGLVADRATDFVGRLELIPVEELPLPESGDCLITKEELRELLPPRPFSFHKGEAGRVSIIAGSPGMWGAAALCAQGALSGGAGLITLLVEEEWIPTLLPLVSPEVMIRPRPHDWRTISADAVVIGPGIGQSDEDGERLFDFLGVREGPVVLDADGLNLLAKGDGVHSLGHKVLLTPHPRELSRLCSARGSRAERARSLAQKSGATVLFKGARTIVTEGDSALYYNTTGHPGMATGGQGDTLSGLLGALLGRGLDSLSAAKIGAWVCGRAAEIALRNGESAESLTPFHVSKNLGLAFCSIGG